MTRRLLEATKVFAGAVAVLSFAPILLAGQAGSPQGKKWTPPRTPWGDPDLQGVWNNGTVTPLERPAEFAGKEFLTEKEAAEFEKEIVRRQDADRRDGAGTDSDVARAYNEFWWEHGTRVVATRRTSLVVDPPDGKVPVLTPAARQRAERRAAARPRADAPDTWTDMTLRDRCILYRSLPNLPTNNNNNYQIVQAPGYVAILQEQIHETRVIPLSGGPHLDPRVRQLLGDPRGRWEGDVLVVETTNFTDESEFRGAGKNLHLVERWKRAAGDRIEYEFTVTDPTTWTGPWTAAYTFWKNPELMYEYACHEGNYALQHILENARAAEAVKK